MASYRVLHALFIISFVTVSWCQSVDFGLTEDGYVFFTSSDVQTLSTFVQYANATPDYQDFQNEFYNLTTLHRSYLGDRDEYWGLAASYEGKKIFWNSYSRSELFEFDATTGRLRGLLKFATAGLESIAYDHVTSLLYWTDSQQKAIFAMETENERFLRVYEVETIPPHALAIHTTKRKMFFSVFLLELSTLTQSKIMKCDLDGGNPEAILRFPDVIYVLAITIDYDEDKLFWTDRDLGGNAIVAASDLDGKRRREFFASTEGIFTGLAYHEGLFYVVDSLNTTTSYYKIHIRYKNTRRGEIFKTQLRPRNAAIYGPNKATGTVVRNECSRNRCEHLCLASFNGGSTCKCTEGYKLVGSYRCQSELLQDEYLLVLDFGQMGLFQLPLLENAGEVQELRAFPYKERSSDVNTGMTLNPSNGDLVWCNAFENLIIWGDDKLAFENTVSSMKVHPCLRRLFWISANAIYSWAPGDETPQSIHSLPFFTSAEMAKIVLDLRRNHIYWTENDPRFKSGGVYRMNINGTGREAVLENAPVVEAITIAHETDALYVMSLNEGILFTLPLKLIENVPSTDPAYYMYSKTNLSVYTETVRDIAVVKGKLYLAASTHSGIKRFSIALGPESMENFGPERFFLPLELAYYSRDEYEKYIETIPGCEPVTTAAATTVDVTTVTEAKEKGKAAHPCDEMLGLNFRENTRLLVAFIMCRLLMSPDGGEQTQRLQSLLAEN